MDEQKILLKLVKAWKINPIPEYRGFRCADCQRYLHKAFHHHLKFGGFDTPVHFCRKCQQKIKAKGGILKPFTCDNCNRGFYKTYHVWTRNRKTQVETHVCKNCFLRTQGEILQG